MKFVASAVMTMKPLQMEPGNVSPGYFMPASDTITQTTDDNLLLLEPTQNASTQTPDSNLSFLAEIAGCHGYVDGHKIICPSKVRDSQAFYQDTADNLNISSESINIDKDDFQIRNKDRCNNATIGPLPESMNHSHVVPKRRTCLDEQPTNDGFQNIPNQYKIFKRQRTEYAEKTNEASKLNFAGSISFLSENSMPKICPVSSDNVNKLEGRYEKNDNSFVDSLFEDSLLISNRFLENVGTAKAIVEQDVLNSSKAHTNDFKPKVSVKRPVRCGKCGQRFRKESALNAHLKSNCDPNPHKCDQCEKKFSNQCHLINHQSMHSIEKTFKCDRCAFASKWKSALIRHEWTCFRSNLLYLET